MCVELANGAAQRFREALAIIDTCERQDVRPAAMMLQVYRRILEVLIQTGWTPAAARDLSPVNFG